MTTPTHEAAAGPATDQVGSEAPGVGDLAEENEWCSVAQNPVEELGGVWPTETVYDFTTSPTASRCWETPSMDDDWTHCTPVEAVGFQVTQYAAIPLDGLSSDV